MKTKNLTWAQVEKASKMSYGDGFCGVRIKDLAAFINQEFAGKLQANVRDYSETPYRKYAGSRIRYDYKTAYGLKLEVYLVRDEFPDGIVRPILDHATTDPYRRNWEVARWIVDYGEGKVK